MTAVEKLEKVLSSIHFQSLSDKDLSTCCSLLHVNLIEIEWIIHGRKHFQTHLSPQQTQKEVDD